MFRNPVAIKNSLETFIIYYISAIIGTKTGLVKMKRTLVLIILDGWGVGPDSETNPISVAQPSHIAYLEKNFPFGILQASGIAVGLPWGEKGNSETGHLNIGAGKIIYQYYPKITLSIRDGSFFENTALKKAFEHVKKYDSSINILGLLTQGSVHASLEHLKALLNFAQKEKVGKVKLHLFTDGKDSPPNSALKLLSFIPRERIVSISGRFYAMDVDRRFENTEKTYEAIVGDGGLVIQDVEEHIRKTYEKNLSDEYVEPATIGSPDKALQDNDSLIFFNFREDGMRQLAAAFVQKDFNRFRTKTFKNLYTVTMTPYDAGFETEVAFNPDRTESPLGKVLEDYGKLQLRIAEIPKYAHVTYFFNSLRDDPFKNEYRILIPSGPDVKPEEHPEMMLHEVVSRVIESVDEKSFDFILANFANPDVMAHTGDYKACIEAVKKVDEELKRLTEACLKNDAILIITSDHGNIESVINQRTGEKETGHDINPVPIYLVARDFEKPRDEIKILSAKQKSVGILADVAPTILELMGITKPGEMTGQSLVRALI